MAKYEMFEHEEMHVLAAIRMPSSNAIINLASPRNLEEISNASYPSETKHCKNLSLIEYKRFFEHWN